ERLFVEESVSEEFIRRCVEKTQKLRMGPGSDPGTEIGPLIRPQHVQRMNDLIAEAVGKGAKVVWGGRARPDLGANFFEPTIITGVDGTMQLFQDETFGPIMAIQVVKDAEEALARANDSEFALAASVWTMDAGREGNGAAVEGGDGDGERCDERIRDCGSAARRMQIERMGTGARESGIAGDGECEVRGRGLVEGRGEAVVVPV